MAPGRRPQQSIPSPTKIPKPNPQDFLTINPFFNLHIRDFQRGVWVSKTTDHFHQLILWAERQPSNGSVRGVDRPDGETRFMVAYGSEPDRELQVLLVCFLFLRYGYHVWTDHRVQESIHAKHGEVSLRHDGRDSTGKHWIKCFKVGLTSLITYSLYTDILIETAPRLVGATERISHHLRVFETRRRDYSSSSGCEREGKGAYLLERFLWVS